MNRFARVTTAVTIGTAAVLGFSAPAFAGQAYPEPGFPSANASCVGASMNFQAHYGGQNDTFPTITHGSVGPNMSGHATTAGPGAVGSFESSLAQQRGPIWECLP